MNIIDNAITYVKGIFENEYSGHDFYHTWRVYKLATYIAENENADIQIVQLAALLHDVDDRKLSPETYLNKDKAVSFLKENGVENSAIEKICLIINEVSFAGDDSVVPKTIEGKCVQDADRLDALGAIGIARTFAYGGNHNRKIYDPNINPKDNMNREEYYANESTSINHFYEKLFKLENMMSTDIAKAIAKDRTTYMHEFVNEFIKDWDLTSPVNVCDKKRKTIITVQHTESQHHVNGMIGAWGNWKLTENGKTQAFEVGKWLCEKEGCDSFEMYVSDLARTMQTAEEINKTLHLNPIVTEVIREVNAGDGNGQTREWYNANKYPENGYDPDYRPFDNAESDRDLWRRIYPFYQEIISNPKEKILIVSHGTTLSFLQSMFMGYSFDDIKRARFNGAGGSISKFVIEPTGKITACYINQRLV